MNQEDLIKEYAKCYSNTSYAIETYLETYDNTQSKYVPFKLFPEQEKKEERAEPAPPKKVRVSNTNKKAPPRKTVKPKSTGDIDLSHPDSRKAYESSILKTLKAGKHVDEESGITSQELRKVVGGESPQAREILDELIQSGRVAYYGRARGMRYYLFA